MSILAILRLALTIVSELTTWANNRGLIKAGEAKELARQMEITSARITKSAEAREAVRIDLTLHPDRLRDDDGFRRD